MTSQWCLLSAVLGLSLAVALGSGCGSGDDNTSDDAPTASGEVAESESHAESASEPGDESGGASATTEQEGTNPAGSVDACELLTTDEVEAALGGTAGEPDANVSGSSATCTWTTEALSLQFVTLQVEQGVSQSAFRDSTETAANFLGEDVEEIDGLGDAAYDVGGFVYAHDGEFALVMTNILGFDLIDPGEQRAALETNVALMERAIERLPG